ncbi:MAG: Mrp/NBP35 family ATP-binding protein [Spirochaetes bacterium]|nr:Mrp/NBP35 family ATP-binding protein [Spirochaetota bacterium]
MSKRNETGAAGPVGAAGKDAMEKAAIRETMGRIAHKIIVMSGKGGVGKSTVAVNLAVSLADKKFKTGLLDIDIHGPSVPKLLGMDKGQGLSARGNKMIPIEYNEYLKVMSIGFLLQGRDDAIIWRGPLKYSAIKQFLSDVEWGDLDYLIVDSPPGTGDEPLSICQLIENADGAVVVTTPQDVALIDVRKSVNFCRQLNMPVIGVIENMSGFTCPHCGKETDIFMNGGGQSMAEEMVVPFLGKIPIERHIAASGDSGSPFHVGDTAGDTPAHKSFLKIVDTLLQGVKK